MKPIRILDFRGTYKGGGGPDKTILNSAVQHNSDRVYIQVLYLRDPNDKEFSIDSWANKLGVNYIDIFDKKIIDLNCLSKIRQIIINNGIDIIHSHDDKTLLYGWIIRFCFKKIKLMHTCHLFSPYTRKDFNSITSYSFFKIRRYISIFLIKMHDKPIIAVSNATKKCMVNEGINENDIEVLHNGIDIDFWKAKRGKPILRDELSINDDEFIVGTVARIDQKHKDLPSFYQVALAVLKIITNVKFVIVGEGHGNELKKAKKHVRELGLEYAVYFTGHRTDLIDVYCSFDLFLMTSLTEGLPNTVLEAMALEIPVISTSVAGVPELIEHGKTGFLSPIRDVASLSAQVITLLRNPEMRNDFGKQARLQIERNFSFVNRVRKMEDYYESFVNPTQRSNV